jgi:hypothetical protein
VINSTTPLLCVFDLISHPVYSWSILEFPRALFLRSQSLQSLFLIYYYWASDIHMHTNKRTRDVLLASDQAGANTRSASLLSGREFPAPDVDALAAVALPALLRLPPDLLERMRAHTTRRPKQ